MKKILSRKNIIIIIAILLFLAYFVFTLININHYLNEYGYTIKELPKTVAVYFHLSKGFTVKQTRDNKYVFIGRHDYIYNNVLKKKGYYEHDRAGDMAIYTKNNDDGQSTLSILNSSDWCHWFRVYKITGGKIEDFI